MVGALLVLMAPCILPGWGGWCSADTRLVIEADAQFEYAERLLGSGDFAGAAGEYKRFVHFFPGDERVNTAMYQIGQAYFQEGAFQKAINAFYDLIHRCEDDDPGMAARSRFQIVACHLKRNESGRALMVLRDVTLLARDVNTRDEAFYRSGWILLASGDWSGARKWFEKISGENRETYRLDALLSRLDAADSTPRKDPVTAGAAAIIPGGGHLYLGRYRDALIAFAINGALFACAYESFDNGNEFLGGLLSVVGLGFYTGSIYGSVSGAHKYNRAERDKFIDGIKKDVGVRLSVTPVKSGGVALSLRWDF
ncbi:MAG: tetratricopeptide repeat protein [Desulfobacterales bacterium]|nr:tetratricopeptide repeat protein [Desulfobacterales bacterium]